MDPHELSCAILADRNFGFAEGVRGLLEAVFETVYVVADLDTLNEGAQRLRPTLVALDVSLAGSGLGASLAAIRERSPATRVLLLSVHDQRSIADLALSAGANGIVLKRCAGTDFLAAVDAVTRGEAYISPDFGPAEPFVEAP
jgi:two-component system NarL family response regulator